MKPEIHPEYNHVVFVDGEHEIITRSTLTSKKTREIDGVEHFVIPIDISAYTHPFYTGKQKLVDTEGRVDRFLKRYNLKREDVVDEEEEEEEVKVEEVEEAEETQEKAETKEESSEEAASEKE